MGLRFVRHYQKSMFPSYKDMLKGKFSGIWEAEDLAFIRLGMEIVERGSSADAFGSVLRVLKVPYYISYAKTTESSYLQIKRKGAPELRFSGHSRYAGIGGRSRSHTTNKWEFGSVSTKADQATKFASALRTLWEAGYI